jgi:hypothetical protein
MKPGQTQEYFFTIQNETSEEQNTAVEFTEISYSQTEVSDYLTLSIASQETGKEYLPPTLLRNIISNRYHRLEKIGPHQSHQYKVTTTLSANAPNTIELGKLQFSLRTGLEEKEHHFQIAQTVHIPSPQSASPSPTAIPQSSPPPATPIVLGAASSSATQTPHPPTPTLTQHNILLPLFIATSFLILFLLSIFLAKKTRRPS